MGNFSINGSSIARLVAILVVLLLAPLTASATDTSAHISVQSEHVATGDYHADNALGAVQHHDAPAETPLHCHLKSAQPQASGWTQVPVGSDLSLPALRLKCASALETRGHLPAVSARAPVVNLSRFILFGNFRS